MKTEIRSFEVRIQAAPEGQGPGRLVGTLLTYGERAGDRQEVFQPNSSIGPPLELSCVRCTGVRPPLSASSPR